MRLALAQATKVPRHAERRYAASLPSLARILAGFSSRQRRPGIRLDSPLPVNQLSNGAVLRFFCSGRWLMHAHRSAFPC